MSVSNRHILQQGPVIGGLFRTAVAAVAQQVSGKKGAEPVVPGRIFREKTPPRPSDLVDDYVEHVGGSKAAYASTVPAHFFPQWTFALAGETLNAIQTVQAFTLEELHGRRYDDMVEQSFDTAVKRTRVRAWLIAAAIMTTFSAVTLVLWLGARAVLSGTMTGGDLAKFLSYAIFMGTSVAALAEMWGELQRASGAMERTVELLGSRPSLKLPEKPVALNPAQHGQITFEHLSFSYPSRPNVRALSDFHLEIAPGETVAFVGPSGAGKSTAFSLLLRERRARRTHRSLDVHFVSPAPVSSPGSAGLQPGSRSHAGAWRSQGKPWRTGGGFMKQTSSTTSLVVWYNFSC